MHVALLILLSVVITHFIGLLPADLLNNAVSSLSLSLFHRSTLQKQKALRKQVFQDKMELGKTSSQDQFAKWAKLRRKVDKGLADLEKSNQEISQARSTSSTLTKAIMFLVKTVIPFMITAYHRKTPIFWLPPGGWFGPLGWWLSLPGAPAGAVSATVWSTTCKWVVTSFDSTIRDFFLILFSILGFKVSEEANANPIANQNTQPPADRKSKQGVKIEEIPMENARAGNNGAGLGNESRRRNFKSQNGEEL